MVSLLARVIGVGIETAIVLVPEVLSRKLKILLWHRATLGSPARLLRAGLSRGVSQQ